MSARREPWSSGHAPRSGGGCGRSVYSLSERGNRRGNIDQCKTSKSFIINDLLYSPRRPTEQHEVVQLRRSPVRPMLDVMGVTAPCLTAGESAVLVA